MEKYSPTEIWLMWTMGDAAIGVIFGSTLYVLGNLLNKSSRLDPEEANFSFKNFILSAIAGGGILGISTAIIIGGKILF